MFLTNTENVFLNSIHLLDFVEEKRVMFSESRNEVAVTLTRGVSAGT
jgi:hypothetical protein